MRENRAKKTLEAGGTIKTIGIAFCHSSLAEFLGYMGFDVIIMDTVTQAVSDADVEEFARACEIGGAVPMVSCRPDAPLVRYVSSGIMGFNLKNVESVAEVHAVIDAVKFPPQGKRVTGSWRSNAFDMASGDWPEYMKEANDNITIQVTVEDIKALDLLPAIVQIPDVNVIQIAFHDLTLSMGVSGQKRHPKVMEAFEKARAVILGAGKANSMSHLIDTPAEIRDEYQKGTRVFSHNVRRALFEGSKEFLGTVNALK